MFVYWTPAFSVTLGEFVWIDSAAILSPLKSGNKLFHMSKEKKQLSLTSIFQGRFNRFSLQ